MSNSEPISLNLNPSMAKVIEKLDLIKLKINEHKKNMDDISSEIKLLEKSLLKMAKKQLKSSNANKKPRKLCGFALPSAVSTDLCDFMGVSHGTMISRTEVTKHLMKYISENKLQNPEHKKLIVPDDKLWKLVGDEARDKQITHFTIQKYINKHFIKATTTV